MVTACESGATAAARALRSLQLNAQAEQLEQREQQEADRAARAGGKETIAASVAAELARELDCAVVAMRYPVTDDFAVRLTDEFYRLLWDSGLPVDVVVPKAVVVAAESGSDARDLAGHAGDLRGTGGRPAVDAPESRRSDVGPEGGADGVFPSRTTSVRGPERGQWRQRAPVALAPASGQVGVLMHGMAGAGKTTCAVEVAYCHENTFAALAFWQAPTVRRSGRLP